MIEETVQLAEIADDGAVWVRTQRQSTCGQCAAKSGCGTRVLSEYVGSKLLDVRAVLGSSLSRDELTVGELLVVGLPESNMLKGSLISYGSPLAGLFGLAVPAALWGAPDPAVALLGLAGLVAGLVGVKVFSNRIQNLSDWQPVVLRKADQRGAVPLNFIKPRQNEL